MRITGNTYTAEVTSDERLQTDNKSPAQIAAENQDAYIATVESDPSATDDDFFYLKNTSSKNLHIHKLTLWQDPTAAAIQVIYVKTGVTGSPGTGTAIVPANVYAGGKAASVVCEFRDGDLALVGGITVDKIHYETSATETTGQEITKEFAETIILPPNTAMVLNNLFDPTSYSIDMSIHFYFDDV